MLTKLKKIDFQKNFKITQKIFKFNSIFSINIKQHAVSRFVRNNYTFDFFNRFFGKTWSKFVIFGTKMVDFHQKWPSFPSKMTFIHTRKSADTVWNSSTFCPRYCMNLNKGVPVYFNSQLKKYQVFIYPFWSRGRYHIRTSDRYRHDQKLFLVLQALQKV